MKRFLIKLTALLLVLAATYALSSAQNQTSDQLNSNADSILGKYESTMGSDDFKVQVTKNTDGTYKAQLFWVKNAYDASGKKYLDAKNPDKSLRNTPCDRIVIFNGLKYNESRRRWDSTKIYEPRRGLKANLVCFFEKDGRLRIRGSIGPISESIFWHRID